MTNSDSSFEMKPSTDKFGNTEGGEETSIGYWILQEKSGMPNPISVKNMVGDGYLMSESPNFDVPGSERWDALGVDLGELALPNARNILTPNEFGLAFQV